MGKKEDELRLVMSVSSNDNEILPKIGCCLVKRKSWFHASIFDCSSISFRISYGFH